MSWWRTAAESAAKRRALVGTAAYEEAGQKAPGQHRTGVVGPPRWSGVTHPSPGTGRSGAVLGTTDPPPAGGVMAPPRRPAARQPEPSSARPPDQSAGHRPARTFETAIAAWCPPGPGAGPGCGRARAGPWSTESESSFSTWARRFFRGLVVVVLLLAAISGVRSWISPNRTPETVVSGQSSFPSDEARAVATRYAVSYLTWDEDNADARPNQIGLDLAAGLDGRAGWNGRGKQTADIAYPGEVKPDSNGVTAAVDVRVKVHSFVKQGKNWAGRPGHLGATVRPGRPDRIHGWWPAGRRRSYRMCGQRCPTTCRRPAHRTTI